MNALAALDELLTCRLDAGERRLTPCTIVIFGASGDLTARKLIPALYHLHATKRLPDPVRVIGFARRPKTDASWRAELREALGRFSRTRPVDETHWNAFAAGLHYCPGDLADPAAYGRLRTLLEAPAPPELGRNRLVRRGLPER